MPSIGGDKLRGHLELLVLATLQSGPAHGLEIMKRLEAGGCGLLRLKEGSLYPALYRLEAAGKVRGEWEARPHRRRGARRRIYHLTPKGGRALGAGRDQWQMFVQTVGAMLAAPDATVIA